MYILYINITKIFTDKFFMLFPKNYFFYKTLQIDALEYFYYTLYNFYREIKFIHMYNIYYEIF